MMRRELAEVLGMLYPRDILGNNGRSAATSSSTDDPRDDLLDDIDEIREIPENRPPPLHTVRSSSACGRASVPASARTPTRSRAF